MAEPFKNLIDASLVRALGQQLERHAPTFERRRFETLAIRGLSELELKSRAMQVCDALEQTLPAHFDHAAGLIEACLAPPRAPGEAKPTADADAGVTGWAVWPLAEYVARRGLATPERALQCLHALTQRFTAEWSIRPFIVQHPDLTWRTLQRWLADPSEHVRRLVSEGSRPRLPWGTQLRNLIADPTPTLRLLEVLQDDSSAYVRRSVANHLNDIAKDHPELLAQWLGTHLPDAPAQRRTLLRHASRTLIKSGHARVLQAWGLGEHFNGTVDLALKPSRVKMGEQVELTLALFSHARHAQSIVVDYGVHHVKANGSTTLKVFKGWTLVLGPGEVRTLHKPHSFRPITTRTYHAGRHGIELRINGQIVTRKDFLLTR
jgi:3-methyladenine DNA glycosylase AlkC